MRAIRYASGYQDDHEFELAQREDGQWFRRDWQRPWERVSVSGWREIDVPDDDEWSRSYPWDELIYRSVPYGLNLPSSSLEE